MERSIPGGVVVKPGKRLNRFMANSLTKGWRSERIEKCSEAQTNARNCAEAKTQRQVPRRQFGLPTQVAIAQVVGDEPSGGAATIGDISNAGR